MLCLGKAANLPLASMARPPLPGKSKVLTVAQSKTLNQAEVCFQRALGGKDHSEIRALAWFGLGSVYTFARGEIHWISTFFIHAFRLYDVLLPFSSSNVFISAFQVLSTAGSGTYNHLLIFIFV